MSAQPQFTMFSAAEYELLTSACSYAELALYFSLKKQVNFHTGIFGDLRPTTYDRISKVISRPELEGQSAEVFDRSRARKLLLGSEGKNIVRGVAAGDGVRCQLIYQAAARGQRSNGASKGPAYYSFNAVEYGLLTSACSHAELALYFGMKKQADFRSGLAGENFILTWDAIARLISRPSSQGMAAIGVDEANARKLMGRLVKVGLVSIVTEQPRLKCLLPLSTLLLPNVKKATAQDESLIKPAMRLTQEIDFESAVSQAELGFVRPKLTSSVLAVIPSTDNPQQYQKEKSSSVMEPQAPNSDQGALPPAPPASGWAKIPPLSLLESKLVGMYEEYLGERGDIDFVHLEPSRKNYRAWAVKCVTLETLEMAIDRLRERQPTGLLAPFDLSPHVFTAHREVMSRYTGLRL